MNANPAIEPNQKIRFANFDRLFESAQKDTVIRLRWPLVIFSCYLLYYIPAAWLAPALIQTILSLYLLSHATLYFVADDIFDTPYLYGPLLIFDTAVLIVALSCSGAASPEFYVACAVTLVLSCICIDRRGLLIVTLLAPLLYGYFALNTASALRPDIYLQLPFPFVISLFYGYFAQVARIRTRAREREVLVQREQKSAEELRRQRERLEAMHEVIVSVSPTIEAASIVSAFLEKTLIHLPYAAAIVRLRNPHSNSLETLVTKGFESKEHLEDGLLEFVDSIVESPEPLYFQNVFTDPRAAELTYFKNEGLVSFIGVPLVAGSETLGCLAFLTREEHVFGGDEIDFLSTLAGQAAIALHHSQLFRQSQRQGEALRQADRIKDAFLKTVTNELKAPLNMIAGYTDMFKQGMLGEMTPIQEKGIETIERQSKELNRLIHEVLEVSDIESAALHRSPREISLWEFLSELRLSYEAPRDKNVKLYWDFAGDLPALLVDRTKLKRILENLISNGVKFTADGSVTVAVRYAPLTKEIEIQVSDTGVGIPADQIAEIFDKFSQVKESSDQVQARGVGLGLYIVKRYVEVLGGQIRVNSRPGQGTVFELRIPVTLQDHPSVIPNHLLLPTTVESGGVSH